MRTISFILFGLAACGGAGVAPSATIASATPETLDPAYDSADDLTIVVDYADGDGDLGEGVAAIHDCRDDGLVTELELPKIASDQAVAEGVPIAGQLTLTVADVGVVEVDDAAPDACAELGVGAPVDGAAVFCVVLRDAAGHDGDGDCTAPITIRTL
jgi:hypothetical protein